MVVDPFVQQRANVGTVLDIGKGCIQASGILASLFGIFLRFLVGDISVVCFYVIHNCCLGDNVLLDVFRHKESVGAQRAF